jgi:hypothetical protein
MEVELLPPIKKTHYLIEFFTLPGRHIPTKKEIEEILNENLDPHIKIDLKRGNLVCESKKGGYGTEGSFGSGGTK